MWRCTALALVLAAALGPSSAYVSTGLPAHTHRAFLLKLTDDICNASPGSLSFQTCKDSHTLMKGWAEAPEKLQNTQFSGKERAMAVEANDE